MAAAGSGLVASAPEEPARSVREAAGGRWDHGGAQALDLVIGERNQSAGAGAVLGQGAARRSKAGVTARKVWARRARATPSPASADGFPAQDPRGEHDTVHHAPAPPRTAAHGGRPDHRTSVAQWDAELTARCPKALKQLANE